MTEFATHPALNGACRMPRLGTRDTETHAATSVTRLSFSLSQAARVRNGLTSDNHNNDARATCDVRGVSETTDWCVCWPIRG